MKKFSAEVDENDWAFGQVLPAFLVLGPIVTAVKGAFDGHSRRLPSSTTGSATPREPSVPGSNKIVTSGPDHLEESLEMRRFRQLLSNCLGKDYYDTSTCSWIIPVFCFMCIQILEVTVMMFIRLVASRSNAVVAIFSVFRPISIVSPTATYIIILACLLFEHHRTDNKKHVIVFSSTMSIVVFALYSSLSIWVDYIGTSFGYGQDLGSISVAVLVFVIILLGYLTPTWIFGKICYGN